MIRKVAPSGAAASKVAVIGGGAIGGVLAEAACVAGHDVTVCVRAPVPALTVERGGRARDLPARITADPAAGPAGRADWVLRAADRHGVAAPLNRALLALLAAASPA